MKLYTMKDHDMYMCMKKGNCCWKRYIWLMALGLKFFMHFQCQTLSLQLLSNQMMDFNETLRNERSWYIDVHEERELLPKRYSWVMALGLRFFMHFQCQTLSSQLLPNQMMDFNETLHNERSWYIDVHEEWGLLSKKVQLSYGPWTKIFHAFSMLNFVIATSPKPNDRFQLNFTQVFYYSDLNPEWCPYMRLYQCHELNVRS